MKKCASCTKDLPDAALHCVFCGAKQPPAPASQGMAKTVMGYDASEQLAQLRAQAAARPASATPNPMPTAQPPAGNASTGSGAMPPMGGGPAPSQAPTMFAGAPPALTPPPPSMGSGGMAPMGGGSTGSGGMPPMGGPQGGYGAPQGGGYAPPQGGYGQPQGGGYAPPQGGYGQPQGVQPVAAIPSYMSSQQSARAGRPIEPWKDTLRLQMLVWGAILVGCFLVPLMISPKVEFVPQLIGSGNTLQKITALLVAAVGGLSLALSFIPMATGARGAVAGVLGLAGAVVPVIYMATVRDPEPRLLALMAAPLFILPGLLLRDQYREASLPRILVTIGVVMVLAALLIPDHGRVPLVELFKGVIDAPGKQKLGAILIVGYVAVVVVSLLVWTPSPSSGAAKPLAWILILYPAILAFSQLLVRGEIGAQVKFATNQSLVGWVWTPGELGIPTGYAVLLAYGFASALGKKLE